MLLESLESLIFIKESPKSKLTRESLDFSMLAIQIWTMELVGAQNNSHPQATQNTDWPLGDHNVTRAAWSPVCKGCWLILGSAFLCRNKELLCMGSSCRGWALMGGLRDLEFPTRVGQRAQTSWALLCAPRLLAFTVQGALIVRLQLCFEECESA